MNSSKKIEWLLSALRAESVLLRAWAVESKNGGWSTHQVEPMLKRAFELEALVERLSE